MKEKGEIWNHSLLLIISKVEATFNEGTSFSAGISRKAVDTFRTMFVLQTSFLVSLSKKDSRSLPAASPLSNDPQLFSGTLKSRQCLLQILFGVACRHNGANTSLALRHRGKNNSLSIDPFIQ